MKFNSIAALLLSATTAQALWLATAEITYYTAANGGSIYSWTVCQVGKGDNYDQAWSQATSQGTDAVAISGMPSCGELPYKHTNQLGGFWDDYGTINYEDSNWHWYCNTGGLGACDAGGGAPK